MIKHPLGFVVRANQALDDVTATTREIRAAAVAHQELANTAQALLLALAIGIGVGSLIRAGLAFYRNA